MLAKAKKKENGNWITGYPLTYGNGDEWYIIPEGAMKLSPISIKKETICHYTGQRLPDGVRLHEFDIVSAADTDGSLISGIIRFGTYQSCFDNTATAHIGFYVDWQDNRYWRKDLGYWIQNNRLKVVGNTKESYYQED